MSLCKLVGAVAYPVAPTYTKNKKSPTGATKPVRTYQKPLKTKIGPILFNAFKNRKTK